MHQSFAQVRTGAARWALAMVCIVLSTPAFACTPPAPESVLLADCCQRGASTYVDKHDFCYCVPERMATVCRLGPGAAKYPLLKEAGRCQTMSTHPYWPSRSISCTSPPSTQTLLFESSPAAPLPSVPSASSSTEESLPSTPLPTHAEDSKVEDSKVESLKAENSKAEGQR